jgi:hypothetical protein
LALCDIESFGKGGKLCKDKDTSGDSDSTLSSSSSSSFFSSFVSETSLALPSKRGGMGGGDTTSPPICNVRFELSQDSVASWKAFNHDSFPAPFSAANVNFPVLI